MRLPSLLKFGNEDYRVETVPLLEGHDSTYAGGVRYDEYRIVVATETMLDPFETMIHEALHVMDRRAGVGLTEAQVELLGVELARFVKDNMPPWSNG